MNEFSFEGHNDTLRGATCNPQLSALSVDGYHHFYHYQSSAQYLWLAETLRALGREEDAREAFTKAIFQDHGNTEAIAALKETPPFTTATPHYDKHTESDLAFCATIGALPGDATQLHDEALRLWSEKDEKGALVALMRATEAEPMHSNTHFLRGKILFSRKDFEGARTAFEEAVRLSHLAHETYHRTASAAHFSRGKHFFAAEQLDLAIADFSKALDLFRRNKAALLARAACYRTKGNEVMARADETAAALLS